MTVNTGYIDSESKFYWIPCNSLIANEMICTKMPGKCQYSTTHLPNLKRHEETCSEETRIESKQVIYL